MPLTEQLVNNANLWPWLALAGIWELIWKGLALWRAARRQQLGWFVALLIFNTLGILPIIYLLLTRKPAALNQKEPPQ